MLERRWVGPELSLARDTRYQATGWDSGGAGMKNQRSRKSSLGFFRLMCQAASRGGLLTSPVGFRRAS